MPKEINVVFLDDEQNILKSLQRLFLNEPYGIYTTSDYQDAFDVIEREPVKVVVSDQRMPDIQGSDFLKQVKERWPEKIRILFTGYAEFSAAEEAINVGQVYRFISKPWNTADLKSAITQAIEKHDLLLENKRLFEDVKIQRDALKIANRTLEMMYSMQKEFSSTVSHELRTPLASIKMALDIVMSKTAGELTEDQENFLRKAKGNVDRLNRLINDILDLSKLEAGKVEIIKEKQSLNNLIIEFSELIRCEAESKGLKYILDLQEDLPDIYYDKDRMSQVLSNLLSNALKFTDLGQISVTTKYNEDDHIVHVSVADTGSGISKQDVGKLFRKFQQLGNAAERKTGGTGLGLAICKEIVSRHGGEIWVESTEGMGSSFHFTLQIEERGGENE